MAGQPSPVSRRSARSGSPAEGESAGASQHSFDGELQSLQPRSMASANPCATKYCADSAAQAIISAASRMAGAVHKMVVAVVSFNGAATKRKKRNRG